MFVDMKPVFAALLVAVPAYAALAVALRRARL
jgi:hypothetical protein